jgi:tetratricopeptide (TPR) repeat protein
MDLETRRGHTIQASYNLRSAQRIVAYAAAEQRALPTSVSSGEIAGMAWLDEVREWLSKASPAERFSVGRNYARQGRHADAARVFGPLLDLPPGAFGRTGEEYAEMMREIARCAFELGRYADADGILRRGLTDFGLTRNAPALLLELGRCAMAQGQTDRIHEHLDAAWRLQRQPGDTADPAVELYIDNTGGVGNPPDRTADLAAAIAQVLAEGGDGSGAIRYWRRARLRYERTGKTNRIAWALQHELRVLNDLERFGAAADACHRALGVTPVGKRSARQAASLWMSLAHAQINDGRYLAAAKSLKLASGSIRLVPEEHRPRSEFRAATIEGLLLCEQNDRCNALAAFERALDRIRNSEPDARAEGIALNNVAYARVKSGNTDGCEELLTRAAELLGGTPDEAYVFHTRALLARATGDAIAAEQWLSKAMALRAPSRRQVPTVWDWELLGDWRSESGDWAGAAEAYGKAAAIVRRKLRPMHPKRLAMEQKADEARGKAGG